MKKAGNPWYQEPWAWFFVGVLIWTLLSSSAMIGVAILKGDSLVTDQYYKDGLMYNQIHDHDRAATVLKARADLTLAASGLVDLTLGLDQDPFPSSVMLAFYAPMDKAYDQRVRLEHIGNGHYRGQFDPNLTARYRVELSGLNTAGETWRLPNVELYTGHDAWFELEALRTPD
jgi:hypothetical protein